jgi:hypothetical protein
MAKQGGTAIFGAVYGPPDHRVNFGTFGTLVDGYGTDQEIAALELAQTRHELSEAEGQVSFLEAVLDLAGVNPADYVEVLQENGQADSHDSEAAARLLRDRRIQMLSEERARLITAQFAGHTTVTGGEAKGVVLALPTASDTSP